MQDWGSYTEGDAYSCKVTLAAEDAKTVFDYWHESTFVPVRDVSGQEIGGKRVVVKKYGYVEHFEEEYLWAEIEFWGV